MNAGSCRESRLAVRSHRRRTDAERFESFAEIVGACGTLCRNLRQAFWNLSQDDTLLGSRVDTQFPQARAGCPLLTRLFPDFSARCLHELAIGTVTAPEYRGYNYISLRRLS